MNGLNATWVMIKMTQKMVVIIDRQFWSDISTNANPWNRGQVERRSGTVLLTRKNRLYNMIPNLKETGMRDISFMSVSVTKISVFPWMGPKKLLLFSVLFQRVALCSSIDAPSERSRSTAKEATTERTLANQSTIFCSTRRPIKNVSQTRRPAMIENIRRLENKNENRGSLDENVLTCVEPPNDFSF